MEKILPFPVVMSFIAVVFSQSQNNQTVTLCPLYLVLQNRCPTPTTTAGTTAMTTTMRSTSPGEDTADGNATTVSSESGVTDGCGLPQITFCPAMELFLSGGRTCTNGQTVQIGLTSLGQLLVNPSGQNAAATVGQSYVDALGTTFQSVSQTIQATPTQATIGVTFVPVGQIIG